MLCLVAVKVVLIVLKETTPDDGFEKADTCLVIVCIVVLCVTVLSQNTKGCVKIHFIPHFLFSPYPLSFPSFLL